MNRNYPRDTTHRSVIKAILFPNLSLISNLNIIILPLKKGVNILAKEDILWSKAK
jgi:hypothetical protein